MRRLPELNEATKVATPSPGSPPTHRRFRRFRWRGVPCTAYKTFGAGTAWHRVTRQVIIGSRGEATRFHLRYFEIASEGRTSCERHEHAHVVIGVRGAGTVRVGRRTMKLFPLDVCYIGPWEVHQLVNRDPEPFGFFCIVDAERDPAVPVLKHPLVVPAGATTITRRKRTPQTKAVRPLRRRTR